MHIAERRAQERDIEDIARLREIMDSTRIVLARATTAADSAVLVEQMLDRARGIGRRDYHVAARQRRLDGWWRPTGPGSLSAAAGVALILSGVAASRRKSAA